MKCKLFTTAALLAFLLLPVARAQLNDPMKGNIPFDFTVGSTVLPAGHYTVGALSFGTGVLLLRNSEAKNATIMFRSMAVSATSPQTTKLIFHRYGRTYFLSEIWQGLGQSDGRRLVPSKAERVVARQMAAAPQPQHLEVASVAFTASGIN